MSVNSVNKTSGELTQIAGTAGTIASNISYDDTSSSLGANNAQSAIEILADNISSIQETHITNGAHNLLIYPYTDTSKTDLDITWTDIGDGSIRATGTNNYGNWRSFLIYGNGDTGQRKPVSTLFPKPGKYIISCKNSLLGVFNCDFGVFDDINTHDWVINGNVNPNGSEYIITEEMMSMSCYMKVSVRNNVSEQIDVTFYPMIRIASDILPTFTQYAKTNKQLTDSLYNFDNTKLTKLFFGLPHSGNSIDINLSDISSNNRIGLLIASTYRNYTFDLIFKERDDTIYLQNISKSSQTISPTVVYKSPNIITVTNTDSVGGKILLLF